ncbi:MBL fold metallo-hydrolase [archaeon]|jgi:L-ascorbate metabolism protein UlaG (beta-lactamase superfamily)|nr:MBL fold metallo-hydrolase [archaeon]MBT4373811.1 MBL fold metallo-hydrolase [archaeon]MBT4532277.1 MBL fold metallo-hydrolase [archaeon]MBT7001102.1 MBL fold metallo-hydrolase [archaeon]MBT7281991.1 MBL fold metallo-hydrolase [archaeon]
MEVNGIDIKWLGNAGILIKNLNGGKVIYIDPYNLREDLEKADLIFLTHSHYDHCSVADISKIIKSGTKIIMPADCQSKILRFEIPIKYQIVSPGFELSLGEIKVSCFPAYNLDKNFHPKNEEWVGYLIKIGDVLIYHSGDTDKIPEMQRLTGHKQSGRKLVAILSVGGRFTMNAEEAAEAAKLIKPDIAIPIHYGSVSGTLEDAEEFKELCELENVKVKILEKE